MHRLAVLLLALAATFPLTGCLKDEIAALRAELAELKAAQKPAAKPVKGTSTDGTQPGDAAG